MHIVQYHPRALVGDGGISNSVRNLSRGLAAAGASPVIAHAGTQLTPPDGPVRWVSVPHRRIGPFDVPVGFETAIDGADVVVLNSAWTAYNVRAGAAAHRVGVPYIVADRGAYDPLILQRRRLAKRAWWALAEQRLVHRATALHAFFDSQREPLRRLGFAGPVIVAPNGVEVPPNAGWDGGSGGYLLYVGRFDPEHKGLDLLVRAVSLIAPEQRPQLRLHGPDWRGGKQRVEGMIDDLGLRKWILVGPPVYGDEKWSTMTAATGFVYPSRWEAFGNAPAEAAALGVPTLTTPYPLGRHLREHDAALVVAPTPHDIADGLRALSAGLPQMGRRAAALVRDQLTWDAVARSWLRQLEALL